MSTIPTFTITPAGAADAYSRVDRGDAAPSGGDFGATLQRTLQGVTDTLHGADTKAMEALSGGGNLTEVVTSLARAELTLQTATTVRDRVLQAYQDIIKMPV